MKGQRYIPTLSSHHFKRVYVKSGQQPPADSRVSTSEGYFELMHRCIWSNHIPAHRLDFYMVFLVTSGEGLHTFGSETRMIGPNTLCFVGPEMINSWQSGHHNNSGYVCTFSAEFFGPVIAREPSLSELPFFQVSGPGMLSLSDEQMTSYTQLFEMMQAEARGGNAMSSAVLRGYLHALIHKARGDFYAQDLETTAPPHAGARLLKAFKQLFMSDLGVIRSGKEVRLRRISEYAKKLGVSQNHLNDTVKALTGQSAGEMINKQLLSQATMCLKHSLKNVSEIAYLLGFEDPSYFARFYKRHTGKTPSETRPRLND